MPTIKLPIFSYILHQWFVVRFCFHSCWCVVLGISMCRISKPMLLSLEDHGTSERRYVAKHVLVLSHMQHSVHLIRTLVRFPPWFSHIGVQNKTTSQWWSLPTSKQTLVWSDCPDSVHQTGCGFWVVGKLFGVFFWICKLLKLYAEWSNECQRIELENRGTVSLGYLSQNAQKA